MVPTSKGSAEGKNRGLIGMGAENEGRGPASVGGDLAPSS